MTKSIRESNGDLTGLALNAMLYFINIHESTSSNFHQEWEEFRNKKTGGGLWNDACVCDS